MGAATLTAGSSYWRCTEFTSDSERLYYSRFIISPLEVGQANTLGAALRRALLGAPGGVCTTLGVLPGMDHEYTAIAGVRESVHDISMNFREIVLRGHPATLREAYVSTAGPGRVTARDIVLPPPVGIIDPAQHTATLTRKIKFNIRLGIGRRGLGYSGQSVAGYQKGQFPLGAPPAPIRNVNYSVHCYGNHSGGITKEMLTPEIWTNGGLTPLEAVHEASQNLINLFGYPFARVTRETNPAERA
uniref:RNA polymerase alpha subunit n=1 Tax=Selaginella remotifolia TaxID=137170 RepID=A0A482CGF1_SELRE|nr:RNA polymerase alpha subunit [Selaginella remotifolia]QBL76269.1 RNA polymerase alpha subunit [Selaginella remotifolia]